MTRGHCSHSLQRTLRSYFIVIWVIFVEFIHGRSNCISTEEQFRTYVQSLWLPNASDDDIDKLMEMYPSDVREGSPFDTGTANALTPQYKRIAAFQGDVVFQGPRRFFVQQRSGEQNIWSFCGF